MSAATFAMLPSATQQQSNSVSFQTLLARKASVEETYEFTRIINEGSTACVYEAQSRFTGQIVAIKEVRNTPASHTVVLNERDMLDGLEHPNIAKLLDFEENPQTFLIVQELCKGGDLFDVIAKNPKDVNESRAMNWMRGVLQGLIYLHSRGIVHRDIKMENVALGSNGDAKLIDFGYASSVDYQSIYTPGTEEYIAPELFTRVKNSAADLTKADVWAAGILLFTLLTASYDRCNFPWSRADNSSESFKAYRATGEVQRRPWGSFSNASRFLLLNMLKCNPAERCTAVEALAFINDHWPLPAYNKPSLLRASSIASNASEASVDSGFDSDEFGSVSDDELETIKEHEATTNVGATATPNVYILRHACIPTPTSSTASNQLPSLPTFNAPLPVKKSLQHTKKRVTASTTTKKNTTTSMSSSKVARSQEQFLEEGIDVTSPVMHGQKRKRVVDAPDAFTPPPAKYARTAKLVQQRC